MSNQLTGIIDLTVRSAMRALDKIVSCQINQVRNSSQAGFCAICIKLHKIYISNVQICSISS